MNETIDNREDWEKGPVDEYHGVRELWAIVKSHFQREEMIDKMLAERSSAIQEPRLIMPRVQSWEIYDVSEMD